MVTIAAGYFAMGCLQTALPACAPDAQPRHRVWLDAYAIDTYEVTVGDYASCQAAGVCWKTFCGMPTDGDDKPMRCVGRGEASVYCKWLGKRLPTEAEWERAARGLDDRPFPWGEERPDGRTCWQRGGPCDVGSFPSGVSPAGAHDMAGNVSEWVSDLYHPHYYSHAPERNPTGHRGRPLTLVACSHGEGGCGVTRGGSWASPVEELATTARAKQPLDNFTPWRTAGFRCARPVAKE
jgi:iron(II)-dependent oxidoreductase